MKRTLLLIIAVACCLYSCSDPKEDINEMPTTTRYEGTGGTYFNSDSVTTPDKSILINSVKTFTLIDTTVSPSLTWISAGSMTSLKPKSAAWDFSSNPNFIKVDSRIEWNTNLKKWLITYPVNIIPNTEVADFPMRFNLQFENGKSVSRDTKVSIKQTVERFDIFKLNFGMNRAEVRDSEQKRGDALFYWYEPTLTAATSTNYGFISNSLQFIFEDNKLVSITEFGNYLHIDSEEFSMLIKKLGFNGKLEFSNFPVIIKQPISWVKNGIKFTIHNKDIDVPNGIKNFNVLTYEKAK